MKIFLAALTLLVALSSGSWSQTVHGRGEETQPDGTTFMYYVLGDTRATADGYVFVYSSDGWAYYAQLDVRGEYMASPYKVGIDDPEKIGIPRNLQRQRSTARQAEIDAANIRRYGTGTYLTQPDGTEFLAYWGGSLGFCQIEVPADGYVIAIVDGTRDILLINYFGVDPFWAFVYDDESGWYYYADYYYPIPGLGLLPRRDAQGEYAASPYKVGIDDPPGYDPPTAVQERSWGAVKHRFHR